MKEQRLQFGFEAGVNGVAKFTIALLSTAALAATDFGILEHEVPGNERSGGLDRDGEVGGAIAVGIA